jgi:hypothetical protein
MNQIQLGISYASSAKPLCSCLYRYIKETSGSITLCIIIPQKVLNYLQKPAGCEWWRRARRLRAPKDTCTTGTWLSRVAPSSFTPTHIKTLGVYFDDLSSSISKVTHAPTSFVRLRHKIKISKPTLREIVLPFSKRASDKMLFAVPSETKYYITWIWPSLTIPKDQTSLEIWAELSFRLPSDSIAPSITCLERQMGST